jgi:twitching motility protein PilT
MDINKIIAYAVENHASDIHLNVGVEPILRIDGRLKRINEWPVVTEEEALDILKQITDTK